MGWGGKRAGAGRKPNAAKVILAKTVEEAGEDAQRALGLLISFVEDPLQDPALRRLCANDVMNRVWGKPTERQEVTGKDGGPLTVRFVYDDGGHPPATPTLDDPEDAS